MLAVGVPPHAWRCRTACDAHDETRHASRDRCSTISRPGTGSRRYRWGTCTTASRPRSLSFQPGGRLPASALATRDKVPMEPLPQVAFPISAAVVVRQRKGPSPCVVTGEVRAVSRSDLAVIRDGTGSGHPGLEGSADHDKSDPGPAWATHHQSAGGQESTGTDPGAWAAGLRLDRGWPAHS